VPDPLAELVLQCLAQKPEERPAGAAEVAERLRGWLVRAASRWRGADGDDAGRHVGAARRGDDPAARAGDREHDADAAAADDRADAGRDQGMMRGGYRGRRARRA
jgi:hypothetical protein